MGVRRTLLETRSHWKDNNQHSLFLPDASECAITNILYLAAENRAFFIAGREYDITTALILQFMM